MPSDLALNGPTAAAGTSPDVPITTLRRSVSSWDLPALATLPSPQDTKPDLHESIIERLDSIVEALLSVRKRVELLETASVTSLGNAFRASDHVLQSSHETVRVHTPLPKTGNRRPSSSTFGFSKNRMTGRWPGTWDPDPEQNHEVLTNADDVLNEHDKDIPTSDELHEIERQMRGDIEVAEHDVDGADAAEQGLAPNDCVTQCIGGHFPRHEHAPLHRRSCATLPTPLDALRMLLPPITAAEMTAVLSPRGYSQASPQRTAEQTRRRARTEASSDPLREDMSELWWTGCPR